MPNFPCAVSADERNHAHAEGIAQQRKDRINEYATELLLDEFNPYAEDNLREALDSEVLIDLCALLRDEDGEAAGRMVGNITRRYWMAKADERATEMVEREDEEKREQTV